MTKEYNIGSSSEYIQKVQGIYNSSTLIRNASLLYNPGYRRYRDSSEAYSMIYSPEIGEKYSVEDYKTNRLGFIDDVGGLVGYTFLGGYLDSNNYRVIDRFEELEKNQLGEYFINKSAFRSMAAPYYEKHSFRDNINYLYNTDIAVNPVIYDLTYLDRLYVYYTKDRDLNVYANYSAFGELNPSIHLTNRYAPDNVYNNITIGSTNVRYSTNERTFFNGTSVDNKIIVNDGEPVKRESFTKVNYGIYNEEGKFSSNGDINDNRPNKTTLSQLTGNSGLIAKTNKLFQNGKIGSLISRFSGKGEVSETQTAVDLKDNSISRGRNLKMKEGYFISNGYKSDYCRVWTSHYQYSKYKNLIRPISIDGAVVTPVSFDESDTMESYRPFGGIRRHSTMQDNGLPLIAPHSDNGELNEEEIKKCMFSIENLAWKDIKLDGDVIREGINKGKTLSAEQRGPNGGRIMWFPPYNLKFSENVGVSWNTNTFIGRGENIYTYTNTERSGQLEFTLLIDHPSILDKYSASVKGDEETDKEILRFFAGCGMLKPENKIVIDVKKETDEAKNNEPSQESTPEKIEGDINFSLFAFFPNNFSGSNYLSSKADLEKAMNYLLNGGTGSTGYEGGNDEPLDGCIDSEVIQCKNNAGGTNYWYYQVDKFKEDETLLFPYNYKDSTCFGLNSDKLIDIICPSGDSITKKELQNSKKIKSLLELDDKEDSEIRSLVIPLYGISNLRDYFNITTTSGGYNAIEKAKKIKIRCVGYASSHGSQGNRRLAKKRAEFLRNYLVKVLGFDADWFVEPAIADSDVKVNNSNVSSFDAKIGRCAAVEFYFNFDNEVTLDTINTGKTTQSLNLENTTPPKTDEKNERNEIVQTFTMTNEPKYDDEFVYFKKVGENDDFVKEYITDKVKYFNPAFHSITPEGFNARLTFLHQCTRQGPTTAVSDKNSTALMAGNLAFGRPPVCVLRIGDFYNTRIIIDSVNINYDNNGGVQWDLNTEGIGLQPMYATVTIGFKFIGGSDLSGPISRLQNAVSYNFFANTSVYDRRADYREGWVDSKTNEWEPENNATPQSDSKTSQNNGEDKKK